MPEDIARMWNLYLALWGYFSGQELPLVSSIERFSGSRRDGKWQIERHNETHLVFEQEAIFETILTPKGRSLQNSIGDELSVTSWADVSV
jgi:hypothetical protein